MADNTATVKVRLVKGLRGCQARHRLSVKALGLNSGNTTRGHRFEAAMDPVVLNDAVTLGPCAVAHGSLSVTISSTPAVSQPAPLSQGQTVTTEKTDIAITQQGGALVQLPAGAKLADVVKALNALGATPQDLLAILQAIKSAGALNAEIEVI